MPTGWSEVQNTGSCHFAGAIGQSREWVDGSWVMGQMGHENRMGHMGHGSLGVDP